MKSLRLIFLIILLVCAHHFTSAQSTYIDDGGILRWTENNEEIRVFGTNYAIPFSYWESRAPIVGDYKKAIEEDVYHMARLGIDGYRVHVWPDYITDSVGNLVFNEHLQLFDFLLSKLKERNIKLFITPMYHSEEGTGFVTAAGGKNNCINDTTNWKYQVNYLHQFVSHVNPYTGIALKDEPDVMAMAITNEPSHWQRPDLVTSYINTLMQAMRDAGMNKPVFYNMTTCAAFIDQVLASNVQGGTFQWYPSGLTSNHNQEGNFLPHVDNYYIPFDDKLKASNRAKFVYEFSPSDIGKSAIIYPAMARSFREAGFQFAAHFAYDPLHAAYCNIEYRTHFLNLAYTPQKALGLKIAAEAFRKVPLYKDYGPYPKNNQFEDITLSYEKDLAELVNKTQFFYSNNTITTPPSLKDLKEIAGYGNSPVVNYPGKGIYFLDKLEDGAWRLEVMPDAHWVRDPFFVPSVKRETAVCLYGKHRMNINLPDLNKDFSIERINHKKKYREMAQNGGFDIEPGVYLLKRKGITTKFSDNHQIGTIHLGEYHAPDRKPSQVYVLHNHPKEVETNSKLSLKVNIISETQPDEVELIVLGVGGGEALKMERIEPYSYKAEIPEKYLKTSGILRYNISYKDGDNFINYPSGDRGEHILKRRIYGDDRTFADGEPYKIRIVEPSHPVTLFDADRDWMQVTKPNRKNVIDLFPSSIPGKSLMHVKVNKLTEDMHDFSVRSYCGKTVMYRQTGLNNKKQVVVYGQSLSNKPCTIQIALIMKDGSAFGKTIEIDSDLKQYSVIIKDLERTKLALLPRPYPKFHAYWFEPSKKQRLEIEDVENIQISIGPGIEEKEWDAKHGIALGWIQLQ